MTHNWYEPLPALSVYILALSVHNRDPDLTAVVEFCSAERCRMTSALKLSNEGL